VKVEFKKSFERDLKKLRNKDILTKIKASVVEIENSQSLENISNLKKLQTKSNYYRIRGLSRTHGDKQRLSN
jgi:mRNA interferase RelE/StbE